MKSSIYEDENSNIQAQDEEINEETFQNKNLVTDEGFKGKLQALGRHVSDFFGGSLGNHWTRGMLAFYEERLFGSAGDFYSDGGLFDFDNLKLDAENRTLSLENSSTFNNNPIVYNLDGWTGRYGMPIDFLLSVHVATMMPDLAYDMANSFETEVRIILHSMEGEYADAAFLNKGQYIPYYVFEDLAGTGVLGTDFAGSLNSWKLNNEEAMLITKTLDIDSPETCLGTTEMNDQEIYSFSNNYEQSSSGIQRVIDDYNGMIDKMKENGYSGNDIDKISTIEEFEELLINTEVIKEADNYEEENDKEFEISSLVVTKKSSMTDSFGYSYDYDNLNYSWIKDEGSTYYIEINIGKFIMQIEDTSYITYGISYRIMRKRSEEEIQEFLEKTGVDAVEKARCSQLDNKECCDNCKDYIKTIYDLLAEPHDTDYDYYIPYIESVRNHWYRNVYFTKPNNVDFVQNDYEYEALIKERWTAYETYPTDENADNYNPDRVGEFILYRIYTEEDCKNNPFHVAGTYQKDENGNFIIFDGTLEEAKAQKIAVAKKAKTIDSNSKSTLLDLGWNPETLSGLLNSGIDWMKPTDTAYGVWTAYTLASNQSTIWERTYADSELENENDQTVKLVKQNLYSKIISSYDIVQTGEGQRGETNWKIKNMFLSNTYFRYDGTPETAEKITSLRQKIKLGLSEGQSEYGALNNLNSKDYTNKMLTPDGKLIDVVEDNDLSNTIEKEENIKVKDYSGQVTINQDALNAFSMLENSHTLDADYIYRDFKELIVELGYFTKEELTDETPRLLQWIVPEVGSTGYPNRTIDKRENESGTMIHSKIDISANDKYTLNTLIRENEKAEEVEGDLPAESQKTAQITQKQNSSFSIKANGNDDLNTVMGNSATSQVQTINTSVSVDEFLEIAEEVHSRMEGDVWEYCWGSDSHKTGNNSRHGRENGSHERYETYKESEEGNKTADCSSYVCWVLQEAGILPEKTLLRSTEFIESDWFKGYVIPIEQAGEWQPGDILAKAAVGDENGHVQINGKDGMQYNAGSDKAIQTPPHVYEPEFGPTHIIRLPFGTDNPEQPYLGYSGNEAVVSPVTGILLEYGTYDNEGITPELLEKKANRINVDLKYGPLNYSAKSTGGTLKESQQVQSESGGYVSKIVADEVGYARILVLDTVYYQVLEQSTNNIWKDAEGTQDDNSKSLVSKNGAYSEYLLPDDEKTAVEKLEELDENSPLSATVYGYKEFAELYSEFGIAGYEIFIDGFIPELPDGEDLDIDYFKKITQTNFESENQLDNKYIPDEEYKFPSESYTDKYKAETAVKKMATSSIYVPSSDNKITNEDLIFIKEGTVLGRTMTDKELIEKIRDGKTGTYEENRPKEKSVENGKIDQIIGNYLRIIMKNDKKEVVENIEDYMKIEKDNIISLEAAIRALEAINKNSSIKDKVIAMMNYYIAMGFTKEAAAGIVANAFSESSLDPTSHTAGTSFYGLYQMDMGVATDNPLEAVEGSNWDMQMKWMEENGYNYNSFAGQVRAVIECENYLAGRNSWGNIEQMKVRKDPKDAAEYWEVWIEGAIGGDKIEENLSTWGPYWAEINGHYSPDSEDIMYYQGLGRRKRRAEMAMDIYDGKTDTFSE